jgi:glycerophosphoryl diester phosphodiesterase
MNRVSLLLLLLWIFWGVSCKPTQDLHTLHFEDTEALQKFFDFREQGYKMVSAHRGGSYAFYPENCLETFKYVLEKTPAILEVDVEMSRDSVLLLMHDATLDRTTTGLGSVRDKRWGELRKLQLKDRNGIVTPYKIPKFEKVLDWATENTILTVDVKEGVPMEKVIRTIEQEDAEACVAIIVYDLESAKEVHAMNPELMISLGLTSDQELKAFLESDIPAENIIAFTGLELKPTEFYKKLHELGIPIITATFNTLDLMGSNPDQMEYYRAAWSLGIDIIATDLPIEIGTYLMENKELMNYELQIMNYE